MEYIWDNQCDVGVAGVGALASIAALDNHRLPFFPAPPERNIQLMVIFCHIFDTAAMIRLQQFHNQGKHTVLCAAHQRPHFHHITSLSSAPAGVELTGDPVRRKGALFVGAEQNQVVSVVNCGLDAHQIHQAVRVARHLGARRQYGMFDFNHVKTIRLA